MANAALRGFLVDNWRLKSDGLWNRNQESVREVDVWFTRAVFVIRYKAVQMREIGPFVAVRFGFGGKIARDGMVESCCARKPHSVFRNRKQKVSEYSGKIRINVQNMTGSICVSPRAKNGLVRSSGKLLTRRPFEPSDIERNDVVVMERI